MDVVFTSIGVAGLAVGILPLVVRLLRDRALERGVQRTHVAHLDVRVGGERWHVELDLQDPESGFAFAKRLGEAAERQLRRARPT